MDRKILLEILNEAIRDMRELVIVLSDEDCETSFEGFDYTCPECNGRGSLLWTSDKVNPIPGPWPCYVCLGRGKLTRRGYEAYEISLTNQDENNS